MDLIYMNSEKEDIGVLKDYKFDLAFGTDENDFECTVSTSNHVCKAGYYLYYENTEYGGIIDSIKVDTDSEEIKYIGRTWHGMLESHILQPDDNQDYLVMSGEANAVLSSLISRLGIGSLFKASTDDSGINISSYKMNRYIGAYEGMRKMLKASGGKLNISFKDGFVEISAKPLVDYSQDEQFDTDQIDFDIQMNYKPINHVICLGKGDLKDRRVIHVYADEKGNISGTQTFTGLDEVCKVYDNSNAESDDELKQGGIDMIQESWASMSVDFSFETDNESIDVGDVIGAKERTTGISVVAMISKKIVSISNNQTSISYACEGNTGMVSSGSYPASGSGNVIVIDNELSTKSENPVQNKVVTNALNGKSNNGHTHDEYLNKSGGTVTGTLSIDNGNGGSVNIFNDGEGGNIQLYSPNGIEYQLDTCGDNFRCYTFGDNGVFKSFWFNKYGDFGFEGATGAGNVWLPWQKAIYGHFSNGADCQLANVDSNDNVVFGYGTYHYWRNSTFVFGNYVNLTSRNGVYADGCRLAVNKVLSSPGMFMKPDQTATLSEAVSSQAHGIVLVWSRYSNGAQNTDFTYVFVPKWHITNCNGAGVSCWLSDANGSVIAKKYVYVENTQIRGNSVNGTDNYTASNIYFQPYGFVLRAVLGV